MTSEDTSPADQTTNESSLAKGLRAGFEARRSPSPSVLAALEAQAGRSLRLLTGSEDEDTPLRIDDEARALRDSRGRYQILGELARGGMGVVYKGRDHDLGRDVAVKVLRQDQLGQPGVLERFVEEAQIGGQLQHPGIVPVYELGLNADERPYFAMKLVKGETLAELLEARRDPSADRTRFLQIFEQVCNTIAYAHDRRVVHRDLKPCNVMIGTFGEVQVVDWGLAKILPAGGIAEQERTNARHGVGGSVISTVRTKEGATAESIAGSAMGTPAYMSPEQARGDVERIDRRSDVFGLGAILCEILTGKPPYVAADRDNDDVMLMAARGETRPAVERLRRCGGADEVVDLCIECLSSDHRERPTSAKAVADRIHAHRASVEERARQAAIGAAEARVRSRATRRLAAFVVVLVLAVSATVTWWQFAVGEAKLRGERDVADLMQRATGFLGMASQAGSSREDLAASVGFLDKAVRALDQAKARAEDTNVSDDTRRSVEQEFERAQSQLARLREQRGLAQRKAEFLEAASVAFLDGVTRRGEWLSRRLAERQNVEFWAALEALVGRAPEEVAYPVLLDRLGTGDRDVETAELLEFWAMQRSLWLDPDRSREEAAFTETLRRVADDLDPDPERRRLRRHISATRPETIGALGPRIEGIARELLQARQAGRAPASASFTLLGEALWLAGLDDIAVEVYREGRRANPRDPALLYRLSQKLDQVYARSQSDESLLSESRKWLQVAAALFPEGSAAYRVAHQRLGSALMFAGSYADAMHHLKIGKDYTRTFECEIRWHGFDAALMRARKAAANGGSTEILGTLLNMVGQHEEAALVGNTIVRAALTLATNDAATPETLLLVERALEQDDDDAVYLRLAKARQLERLGRHEEAIEWYRKASTVMPWSLVYEAKARERLGFPGAKRLYENVIAYNEPVSDYLGVIASLSIATSRIGLGELEAGYALACNAVKKELEGDEAWFILPLRSMANAPDAGPLEFLMVAAACERWTERTEQYAAAMHKKLFSGWDARRRRSPEWNMHPWA